MMPRLLYVGQTPAEGTGSPVIVLRHLQRLAAAGWEITIVAEDGQNSAACVRVGWQVVLLPLRRWWWPPFRRQMSISRTVRTWLLAGKCRNIIAGRRPDAVLSYLAAHDDFYPEIAARYAVRYGIPLSLLIHDDAAAFGTNAADKARRKKRQDWMLQQAHRYWFVTPELAKACGEPATVDSVLPPIPAAQTHFARWQETFALRPRVYYAGSVWPAQLSLLGLIAQTLEGAGARLVLIARETPELTEFCRRGLIPLLPPFPTNREALAHLAEDAAGVLVSYADSVEQMPWTATSFPSKLVEYAQLGLPCAIVAPTESAVGRWARREGYANFFPPRELARLAAWARDLGHESTWRRHTEAVRQLAIGEFNPEKIQATFAAGLLRT